MSNQFTLTAQKRNDHGKAACRRMRRLNDQIPAVLYGGEEQPLSILLDHKKVAHALENEAFYSHILTIQIDGKDQKAVLKDVQRHPVKSRILHMDFMRITGKEKIHMHVPLHFIGEENAPGVIEGGVLSHQLGNVEVVCLPQDLPEFIEVDVSHMKLDEVLHISQLKLPKGVELVALAHDNDLVVSSIHLPKVVIEEPVVTETTEVAAEGAEAAEGEAAAPGADEEGKSKE